MYTNTLCITLSIISRDYLLTQMEILQVVIEEEMSRNIMVFGLHEEENEILSSKISEVFETLGEKPCIEASRVGRENKPVNRLVKVKLSSSLIVNQILRKSRNLRTNERFKTVFLAPDRTFEQRVQHKELVQELKNKSVAEPGKKFFIREGKILCADSNS